MSTIVHIAGARPNFPKLAPVRAALEGPGVDQLLIHTGQHYATELSEVFFTELGIPEPDLNLGVGSGSHTGQTAAVMLGLERELRAARPDLVVVYGDVNSTVAAALVTAKEGLALAHVEAGLRSYDRTMPEEVNRVVTDSLADLLLTTSAEAETNLALEGIPGSRVHFVGNPMIDTLLRLRPRFDPDRMRAELALPQEYAAVTLHRPANVDDSAAVAAVVRAAHAVADRVPIVLPLHPRGRERLLAAGLGDHPAITVTGPLGYLDFMSLVSGARLVVTDSGGVQEETTVLGIPCLTLRPNTERPVTIWQGTNRLTDRERLGAAVDDVLSASPTEHPVPPLWDGAAGERIAAVVRDFLAGR